MTDRFEQPVVALGLMSGTSADGVDAALIRTDGEQKFEFIDAVTIPYREILRTTLIELASGDDRVDLMDVMRIEQQITDIHIDVCKKLLERTASEIEVIGFHGHTIRHVPEESFTWQIGDASRLAHAMQTTVVSDFRRRDMAAGGQGAPLAALFHQAMLRNVPKPTLVLNLGGVGNITWLGSDEQILAGDTGPGCGLLDEWTRKHIGTEFDEDGMLASKGEVHQEVVDAAISLPFYSIPLPRSADRFQFRAPGIENLDPADGAATLCALTVAGVESATKWLPERPQSVWITGGGSHHPVMMRMLRDRFADVQPLGTLGLRPDSLEAECFAWLAVRRLRGLPTSLPETTGCSKPTCGGMVSR